MDRPGVSKVAKGSGEQRKMESLWRKIDKVVCQGNMKDDSADPGIEWDRQMPPVMEQNASKAASGKTCLGFSKSLYHRTREG